MAKPVFIYCLKDPRNGDVRYIGQTNNLKRRFQQHLIESVKKRNCLGDWLQSLKGEKPVLAILHEVAEGESWAEEERRYISCAHAIGVDLVNATDGGEGSSGPKSPETCAKISAALTGLTRSPAHCAALSAAKKGVPQSPAQCAAKSARMTGVPRSPEARDAARKQCAVMSAAKIGVPLLPETRAKISAALTGLPKSPETRAKLSAARKGVPNSPKARAKMSAVRKGVPWTPAQREAHERGKLAKSSTK